MGEAIGMKEQLKKACLVIGGSGFIGSHLVRELLATGRSVTVLDRNKPVASQLLTDVKYIAGDFSDAGLIQTLVPQHAEVIHLAYASKPNTSNDDPVDDLMQNLPATVRLFDVIAQSGARLLLVSSGGTVYGQAVTLPIREDHPTQPVSPYGITKLTIEKYASLYAQTKGLKFVCVRPANAYGAGQLPFLGQGFIATAMALMLEGKPVSVFGECGTVRDYIYIYDLVSGMVSVLEHGCLSETYNLGSGIGLSNLEVITQIQSVMLENKRMVEIQSLPERGFDVLVNILDTKKVHELTGWKPVIDFKDGLKRTKKWLEGQM